MNPETAAKVADSSRSHAENYKCTGNFGRAFSHLLIALKLKPEWKEELKETFSTVLCNWGTTLEKDGRTEDLFKCYEQAVEVFPENEYVLNNLGAHLLRFGSYKEAVPYFRRCLAIQPYHLQAFRNLENGLNAIVERWHFRMLNDDYRNDAFREAIIKKICQGFDCCLDIGTGTGLLSLFMLEGKAKKIYACDSSLAMVEIASQVLKNNGSKNIKLFNKHSTDLKIPEDIPEKVPFVATEILDSGLLGEHVLQTLSHAWSELLLPPYPDVTNVIKKSNNHGIVVPFGAKVLLTAIECDTISRQCFVRCGKNLAYNFDKCIILHDSENYDTCDLKRVRNGFKCLTKVETVFYVEFNNPKMLTDMLNGKHDQHLALKCVKSGMLDCFAVWFDLRVDEDITLNTGPESPNSNCWEQAIFPLSKREGVKKGDEITCYVSFVNGKLMVREDDPVGSKFSSLGITEEIFYPSEDVIKLINGLPQSETVLKVKKKLIGNYDKSAHILDAWPFPIFGLDWIISRRGNFSDKLTCIVPSENDQALVEWVAKKYGVEHQVRCVVGEELDCVLEEVSYFDIILLNVVDFTGELKERVVSQMDVLRETTIPDCLVMPQEVTVLGQFVESDWLESTSKVINNEVTCGYNVAEFINTYQVQHHLDFDVFSIGKTNRTDPFELFKISSSDGVVRRTVPVVDSGIINSMVYWFKVSLLEDDAEFTTVDENSCFNQAAFLFPKRQAEETIKFSVIFQSGIFKLNLE